MEEETIAAISTPVGEGAISIVRLSGPDAIPVVNRVFHGSLSLDKALSHTIHYGKVIDPQSGRTIDEVMVSVMHKPKTYTREDVIEINCHGGIRAVSRVLEVVLNHGARLAEPGEFTKRAFLNGRIDLSQAEAVMDLIRAKTNRAASVALRQMDGLLSKRVKSLRQQLLNILAAVEVNIDYPEYDDAERVTAELLCRRATHVSRALAALLVTARAGKILREGISTAIIGRPNVGKSSLLNWLIQENKAIVTDIPGTTRDVIEEYVNLSGLPLKLIDTAGIRATSDAVERIGVERSRHALAHADLVLLLVDGSASLSDEDRRLFSALSDRLTIVVVTKMDRKQVIAESELLQLAGDHPLVHLSAQEDIGIDRLEQAMTHLFFSAGLPDNDSLYLSNARHIALIKEAKQALDEAITAASSGIPVDMVQIDIHRSWQLLGEIIGETVSDQLINELFSKFCLGK
ncbi:MAG: tRNA uridine-5-carboxymethylaminomethyl(34) synthesis GTPase MnmE [Sporolactobacillus sp.]